MGPERQWIFVYVQLSTPVMLSASPSARAKSNQFINCLYSTCLLSSESYFRLSEQERKSKMTDRLQELQRLSNFLVSLYGDCEIGILGVYNSLELSSSGRQGGSNRIDNSSYYSIMCFPLQELSQTTQIVYSVSYGTYLVFPRIEYLILTVSQQACERALSSAICTRRRKQGILDFRDDRSEAERAAKTIS